jgi:hypothetical protein
MRKSRLIVLVALVVAQLVLTATQAFATFPWPLPCAGC